MIACYCYTSCWRKQKKEEIEILSGDQENSSYNWDFLDTFELTAPNTQSKLQSVSLPNTLYAPCILAWDTNTFMIIGGYSKSFSSSRTATYFVNVDENTIVNGPDLINKRHQFACHDMTVNGKEYIVIVGGNHAPIGSTEILSKSSYLEGWQKSKMITYKKILIMYHTLYVHCSFEKIGVDLPVSGTSAVMVASPSKDSLYIVGVGNEKKDIYQFTCNGNMNCKWTEIESKLKYKHSSGVAMAIPNSLANKICK